MTLFLGRSIKVYIFFPSDIMGSCASHPKQDPESVTKLKPSGGSKTDNVVMPYKPPFANGDHLINDKFGSKEENFFDSQAWLDSDCDDDFLSVNGEFTPSRGSTPVHNNFPTGAPRINKTLIGNTFSGASPEPSLTGRKPRLSDLFKDSLDDLNVDEQNTPLSQKATPCSSGLQSSGITPNGNLKPDKEKSLRSMQCCLPNMLSSRSFNERKKKDEPYP